MLLLRCVGRKDRLLRTLSSMKRLHGSVFKFHPEGFILPIERESFIRYVIHVYILYHYYYIMILLLLLLLLLYYLYK